MPAPIPPWLKHAKGHARRYPTPKGERLNVFAIACDFKINYWTVFARQRKDRQGWPGLDGKPLPSLPMEYTDSLGRKQTEETYLRAEVERALRPPASTSTRIGIEAVADRLGVCRATVEQMVKDGDLDPEPERAPGARAERHTFDPEQVEGVKASLEEERQAVRIGRRQDENGEWWITFPQMRRMLRFGRKRLSRATVAQWEKGTVHLGGEALLPEKIAGRKWYREKQVLEIKASLRNRSPKRFKIGTLWYVTPAGAHACFGINWATLRSLAEQDRVKTETVPNRLGRGKEKTVYCEEDIKTYLRERTVPFDGRYPDGRINLALAGKQSGWTRSRLKKYIGRGWLPSVKQAPPAPWRRWRSQEENTVLPADLEELRCRINTSAQTRASGNLRDAKYIAERLGATRKGDRILLGSLLCEGRESGAIYAERPKLPIAARGEQKRRPWLYDVEEAIRYLRNEGRAPGARGDGEAGQIGADEANAEAKGTARPGRPKGSIDESAAKKKNQILAAFSTGQFRSITELARHFKVSRGRASNIIHGHA